MAYIALYRKFRPVTFEEVVGQEHIETTLKNQIINNRIGHAYLFSGGRGSGKTSTAKIFARAVNCLNPQNGNPCNECENCKQALAGSLVDITEMDAASNNGVDNIRDIREEVEFIPTTAKYRVYIIDEVHMLSTGAFNALLKTLEEPPEHVIFILATTEPQKLPATILSRCQRFDFKRLSRESIIKRLNYICKESNIKIEDNAINIIANLADGAMRDAISILDRCVSDGDEIITEEKIRELSGVPEFEYLFSMAKCLITKDTNGVLECSEKLIAEGKDINVFLWELIKFQRDVALFFIDKTSSKYNEEENAKIDELIKLADKSKFLNLISELSDVQTSMKWSSQPNIMFETGLIKICLKEEKNASNFEEKIAKKDEKKSNNLVDNSNLTESILSYLKDNGRLRLYTNLMNANFEIFPDGIVHIKFSTPLNSATMDYLQEMDTKIIIKQSITVVLKEEHPVKYDFFR